MRRIPIAVSVLLSLAAYADEPAWHEVAHNEDVVVYRKEIAGSDLMAYRGVAVLPYPVAKVMAVLKDTPRRIEWTDKVEKAEIVKELPSGERLEYMALDAPFPVKDRDFLYKSKLEFNDKIKAAIVNFHSVDDPARPPNSDHIRGLILSGSFRLFPISNGAGTRLEADLHADPRGNVPKWIVNKVQARAPIKSLQRLKNYLKSHDIKDDAETAAFFARVSKPRAPAASATTR